MELPPSARGGFESAGQIIDFNAQKDQALVVASDFAIHHRAREDKKLNEGIHLGDMTETIVRDSLGQT